jgi:FAD/FMN-containing dehydrogenase
MTSEPAQHTLLMRFKTVAKAVGLIIAAVLVVSTVAALWGVSETAVERPSSPPIVNDVTQLNPIQVAKIIAPTTTEEITQAVRSHKGPVSIGGGRYSMGGQTATAQTLQIDMRRFNKILGFSRTDKVITVQAGARWRQIQEYIDPHDLSIMIMQTYSNFTVGGSLSVNVHGRYVGSGPLIHSVKSLRVILPDGTLIEASPKARRDIFYGIIGGYGGLGVITEATLQLEDNVRVERKAEKMPIARYKEHFFKNIRDSRLAVFHNADIYPDEFDNVHAVSYLKTDKPVTVKERLVPTDRSYRLDRFVYWVVSEWPFGKTIREYVIEPLLFTGESVRWRNYEASYDVAELEPSSRKDTTYVLQEYFVPVQRFDEFVPKLREILRAHRVNTINVSIRHAHSDPGALLAWAREEVFAFVLYYKQNTDAESRNQVATWTRELIDAVLNVGGSYYLPYQPHATQEQFLKAYPRAAEFFAMKAKLDPENRFRNKLWDKYYAPAGSMRKALAPEVRENLRRRTGYLRDGGQTYLTHPEWYIVYSYDEFAAHLEKHLPSSFPYVSSIGQYWTNYIEVNRLTGDAYPPNWGYQLMLWVIGVSYSVEYTLKGLYENTIGRISEWFSDNQQVDEDRYAYRVAKEYSDFTHVRPWYEYDFWNKLTGLWSETPLWGRGVIRKWERKLIMSLEFGAKSAYGWLIAVGSGTVYNAEADRLQMVVAGWGAEAAAAGIANFEIVDKLDNTYALAATPRYDAFREAMLALARSGAQIELSEISGNSDILVTGVAPRTWFYDGSRGTTLYALPLPTDASRKRVAMRVSTRDLIALLRETQSSGGGLVVDHIYDY